jgi:hypothetical protein
MERALVVGGTGMLAGVAAALAARGVQTAVLARRTRRTPPGTTGIPVDYRDTQAFEEAVRAAGPFDVAVVWIHSVAPAAPDALARVLTESGTPARYVHVLGSAAADPSRPDPGRRAHFQAQDGLRYEEVILGFVHDGKRARWLTNDEIATGVLAAVDKPSPRTVVGAVEPWNQRP